MSTTGGTAPAPHPPTRVPPSARVPPHAYFVTSAVFHYLGPSLAVLLFARVGVFGVTWLRIAAAAAVLALWRRPWRTWRAAGRGQRRLLVALGAVLGAMNTAFYLAVDRLPLGTVGAIEFLGPVLLAASGVRDRRNLAALVLAVGGVALLTDVRIGGEPWGFAFAFANCAGFVLYVVLGHRAAADGGGSGIDRLAASMLVALLVVSPLGLVEAFPAFGSPELALWGVCVGVCSSVVPYVCDQLAMARLPRSTFALLLSLLPATAALMGVLILDQVPTAVEVAGIALVVFGVALHHQRDAADRGQGPESSQRSVGGRSR